MVIDDIVKKVHEFSLEKEYWFVRTDSGKYFDTYSENGFIGIGWNHITVDDIINKSREEVRSKIARHENLDMKLARSKSYATNVYNKLVRFQKLKKGDLVIIPSTGSWRLAFGVISDDVISVVQEGNNDCEYTKRRNIQWLITKRIQTLDPMFYFIKNSRHAISSVKKYSSYIDNVTNHLYLKDGYAHFNVDIKTKKDINVNSLVSFINSMQKLSREINTNFKLEENVEDSSIKLNLQSPGKIEFILPKGKTLITLAMILSIVSCKNPDKHPENKGEIKEFITVNKRKLDAIKQDMNALEIDKERINSIN